MIRRLPRDWWFRPKPIRDDAWPTAATEAERADPVWQEEFRRHGYAHVAAMLRERRRAEKEER